jgi:ubiquinone/menaquinone biosynthesis C-methylase UbiE
MSKERGQSGGAGALAQQRGYSDFSSIADVYDDTREIPPNVLQSAFDALAELGAIEEGGTVLDAGCGTGQLLVPLASMQVVILGLDVSREMLNVAEEKVPQATLAVGDVRDMPYRDDEVDTVLVSKVFQHIRDWRAATSEIKRVLRPGGYLIHLRERGAFRNWVRQQFEIAADTRGIENRYLGTTSAEEVASRFEEIGFTRLDPALPELTWTKPLTHEAALSAFRARSFAEFWAVPDDVYDEICDEVERLAVIQPEGLATVDIMHPWIELDIFRLDTWRAR